MKLPYLSKHYDIKADSIGFDKCPRFNATTILVVFCKPIKKKKKVGQSLAGNVEDPYVIFMQHPGVFPIPKGWAKHLYFHRLVYMQASTYRRKAQKRQV